MLNASIFERDLNYTKKMCTARRSRSPYVDVARGLAKRRLCAYLGLLASVVLLAGCAPRPFDVGADGQRFYLDSMDNAARTTAINKISTAIRTGVAAYRLAPGDTLELMFLASSKPSRSDYALGVGDQIQIEFSYQGTLTRTEVIRPDGKISLPDRPDIIAASLTPAMLEQKVRDLYKGDLRNPVVTVTVERSASGVEDLKQAVTTAAEGRGKTFIVAPDGQLDLPLIKPVRVAGDTVAEATSLINRQYSDEGMNIRISGHLTSVAGNQVFVLGEVKNPGALPVVGPRTILQTIAAAGGVLPTGALTNVRVLYWNKDNQPRLRRVNLESVFDDFKLEEDMIVPPNSTIYVPPTDIAKADRFVDQYIRQLLMFQGSSFTTLYQINGNTINSVTSAAAIP